MIIIFLHHIIYTTNIFFAVREPYDTTIEYVHTANGLVFGTWGRSGSIDKSPYQVFRFNIDGTNLVRLLIRYDAENASTTLTNLRGIIYDGDDTIYIADPDQNRLVKVTGVSTANDGDILQVDRYLNLSPSFPHGILIDGTTDPKNLHNVQSMLNKNSVPSIKLVKKYLYSLHNIVVMFDNYILHNVININKLKFKSNSN